jgi:hypothetical protein
MLREVCALLTRRPVPVVLPAYNSDLGIGSWGGSFAWAVRYRWALPVPHQGLPAAGLDACTKGRGRSRSFCVAVCRLARRVASKDRRLVGAEYLSTFFGRPQHSAELVHPFPSLIVVIASALRHNRQHRPPCPRPRLAMARRHAASPTATGPLAML